MKQTKENQPKKSARWHHLSELKASAFFSLQKINCFEMQQFKFGIGNTI
jgi:hypothetical protein